VDSLVKERLTGAIILVAVLVLLVPELLTGPSRSAQSSRVVANADGSQMRSYTINLADDAASRTSKSAPVTESPAPQSVPAPEVTPPSGSADAGAAKAADAAVESADAPVEPSEQTEGSGEAPPALAKAEPVPTPPPARMEAPKPAPVAPREPAAAVRVEAPSVPASRSGSAEARVDKGWAIQVGSFASRENADRLARNLKGKGFAATVSQSSGKGSKRLWRVRVGPEADRAAAVALGARLRSAGQPGGSVVPYP
jgi:DedD protein